MRAGRAASAVVIVAASLSLASSASAATSAATPSAGKVVPAAGRSMQTLFGSVRVFETASNHGHVKGRLTGEGTGVSVACWTSGADYKRISIWYQVTAPVAGYIPAFNLAAHFSPAKGVPHCLVPSFGAQYYALEANLRIRTSPSISADISGYLTNVGSKVVISCYVNGSSIFGDPVWYRATKPAVGYVAGRFLNTGGDPAPAVPRC
ncbi:MAG TPA: hypothetical protein VFI65_19535 [Streptosporangiaceae bacterium]|nr:hypothetical protein [Streptosporangiaceae bacterium]